MYRTLTVNLFRKLGRNVIAVIGKFNGSAFSVSFFPSTSSSPQRRVFSEMAKAVCSVSSQVRDDHDYDDFTDDDDDDDVDVDGGGDGDDEGALISDEEADTESGFLSQH